MGREQVIPQNEGECYICGSRRPLETHHAVHGTANRKLADEDGLVVRLCRRCHRKLHDAGYCDDHMKVIAQMAYEACIGTREQFVERYGKSYIR